MPFDSLSPEDARILNLESASIAGHTCKILIVDMPSDGGADTLDKLREHVGQRLGRVKRFRQKVRFVPLNVSDPVWVDDESFDIEYHVRKIPTTDPVDYAEFHEIVGQVMSKRLDHSKPLWAIDIVEPLADGGVGLIVKIHHSVADGLTALEYCSQLLWDSEPILQPEDSERWRPEPPPSDLELVAAGLKLRIEGLVKSTIGLVEVAASPHRWLDAARQIEQLPGLVSREFLAGSASTPLAQPISIDRSVASISSQLADYKRIEKGFETKVTVNDVLLAVVAGGLGKWLAEKGEVDKDVRVQVPVSLHHRDEEPDQHGNHDSFMFIDLYLDEPDPVRRLQDINRETKSKKLHHDAEGIDVIYNKLHNASRYLDRLTSKWLSSPRLFSLNVSNVPGPRDPIFVIGAPVKELYSIAEIAEQHALRISAISLAGTMTIGLCTDPNVIDDIRGISNAIEESFEELLALAAS